MGTRVHWTEARQVGVWVGSTPEHFAELVDVGLIGSVEEITSPCVMVLEDAGNCEAWVIGATEADLAGLVERITDATEALDERAEAPDKKAVDFFLKQAMDAYPRQDPGANPDGEIFGSDGRYLLVEESKYGGHFLTRHDRPGDAATYRNTEESEGWEIVTLIDLETGAEWEPVVDFRPAEPA